MLNSISKVDVPRLMKPSVTKSKFVNKINLVYGDSISSDMTSSDKSELILWRRESKSMNDFPNKKDKFIDGYCAAMINKKGMLVGLTSARTGFTWSDFSKINTELYYNFVRKNNLFSMVPNKIYKGVGKDVSFLSAVCLVGDIGFRRNDSIVLTTFEYVENFSKTLNVSYSLQSCVHIFGGLVVIAAGVGLIAVGASKGYNAISNIKDKQRVKDIPDIAIHLSHGDSVANMIKEESREFQDNEMKWNIYNELLKTNSEIKPEFVKSIYDVYKTIGLKNLAIQALTPGVVKNFKAPELEKIVNILDANRNKV